MCPLCGGHVSHDPRGLVSVWMLPDVRAVYGRTTEPRQVMKPAHVWSCDRCEWVTGERTTTT